MSDAAKPERLTLGEALKDFGFFSMLFAVVVSGPSVLSLLQSVFVDHKLVDALQWIVDGYDRITAVLGAIAEPLVQPVIDWLNALLGWDLTVQPYWKPIFLLCMIPVVSGSRAAVRGRMLALAAMEGVAKAVAVLFGSMLAAAMPATGAWWLLGFAAATPFLAMAMATFLVYLAVRRSPQFASDGSVSIGSGIIGVLVFVAAAAMSFFMDLPGAAVVFGVVVGIGWMGLNALLAYLAVEPKPVFLRIAFLNLGGFFAAGLILAADAMLKAFL